MDKTSYDKGVKDGFLKGVQTCKKIIKDCEKDPADITRLSLLVLRELDALEECD